jgi:signal transduction histidine kinase
MALTLLTAGVAVRVARGTTDLLERRAAELDHFAGRVAHDILNSLGAMALSLELVRRQFGDPISEESARSLSRCTRSVERVRQIVNGLLSFARAGARPEPGAYARAQEVIEAVVDGIRPSAEAHGVELRVELRASCALACGPGVLSSLVENLVGNAIKFLDGRAERRVTVRLLEKGASARVEVEDTGPGLPPGSEGEVFQPFARFAAAGVPGVGLGLATVRRLVEGHDGTVGVHSTPDVGCVFWFELPKTRDTVMPAPPPASSP